MVVAACIKAAICYAVMAVSVSGCSTVAGLSIVDVHRVPGAYVVTAQSFGAGVRTLTVDAGLTFGYDRRSYVYPQTIADPPATGRHYLFFELPETRPVAFHTSAVGVDLRASSSNFGVTIGYNESAILASVEADDSIYMKLSFTPSNAKATNLIYCSEVQPCW